MRVKRVHISSISDRFRVDPYPRERRNTYVCIVGTHATPNPFLYKRGVLQNKRDSIAVQTYCTALLQHKVIGLINLNTYTHSFRLL